MHQKTLARNETTALKNIGPYRAERFWSGGRLDEAEPARNGQALWRRRNAILGVAASGDQRADAILHAKG